MSTPICGADACPHAGTEQRVMYPGEPGRALLTSMSSDAPEEWDLCAEHAAAVDTADPCVVCRWAARAIGPSCQRCHERAGGALS